MVDDLTIDTSIGKLNVRVAAWIERNDEILVSSFPDGTISLPGGRVKFGETSLKAVTREIFEETGETLCTPELYAVVENFFTTDNSFHEYLFIYKGTVSNKETYGGTTETNNQTISWSNIENVSRLKPYCLKELADSSSEDGVLHFVNIDEDFK